MNQPQARKRKLTYVLSDFLDRALQFEWIADSRIGREYDFSYVLMNSKVGSETEIHLRATGSPVHHIRYFGKQHLPQAIWQMARIFRSEKTDIVHAHLTGANLGGLAAALLARVPKRIYTRHHSTLNHEYHRHAVAYDHATNFMSTQIVATCENGRNILRELERVPDSKIRVINLGFKLDALKNPSRERIEGLRRKYGLEGQGPIIGVISKYVEWKGIQYAIPAFKKVLETHPGAVLILANARNSPYKPVLQQLLSDIDPARYREIVFELDAAALYHLFDVFVHVPVDARVEAFGQIYIEALAAGIPSVVTLSGIAHELIAHRRNAMVVPYRDSAAIAQSILTLLSDQSPRDAIVSQGRQDVQRFGFDTMVDQLVELYNS